MNTTTSKRCPRCQWVRPLEDFGRDKSKRDGLQTRCRACRFETSRNYRAANRERKAECDRNYRAANRERRAEYSRNYSAANPDKIRIKRVRRRARELQAIPSWVTDPERAVAAQVFKTEVEAQAYRVQVLELVAQYHAGMAAIEADRAYLAEAWGVSPSKLHADHRVPLTGKNVRGLHVPHNLMIRCGRENCSKWIKIVDAPCVEGHLDQRSEADITRVFSGEPQSSPTINPSPALVRHFAQQHAALYA
jgi:hypothetical protein